ncbi:hypothetical protein ZWY2020_049241 [Hordeum vulgare]|nr:hypothetical protein ZWY2020_049241 [Hordeum vulgare]
MLFKALASLHEAMLRSVASEELNFISIPQVDLTSDAVSHRDSSTSDVNPFSSTSLPMKKWKKSQVALALEDYTDFRKKQSAKLIFINTKSPNLRLFWLKDEIVATERS